MKDIQQVLLSLPSSLSGVSTKLVMHSTCLNQDLHLYHMLLLPESWKVGLQLLLLSASNQILYSCFPLCPSKTNKTFKMHVSK